MVIKEQLCPTSKYGIKAPYIMKAEYITVHNTANDASAKSEVSYMLSNNNAVSFHVAIDDLEIIKAIPFDRNAWHAGDGTYGKGNRNSIGIEICYSKSGGAKFDKAEKNAAVYIAQLLAERKWDISRVKKHQDWSGKYCPHRTLDKGWQRFVNMIKAELDKLNVPVLPKLNTSGVYVQSNTPNGIVAGLVTDTKDKTKTEYSWYATIDCVNFSEIKPWKNEGEWLSWKPDAYGNYILIGKARYVGNEDEASSYTTIEFHPHIKGTCEQVQEDGKVLIGIETDDSDVVEILLYDCINGAWIKTTGKCNTTNNSLWVNWELADGAYWVLYRVYKDNIIIDEKCIGFNK